MIIIDQVMMLTEMIAVYCENHTKLRNITNMHTMQSVLMSKQVRFSLSTP
jgi:hypothetical protein